jgi:hypothetical protein
MIGTLNTFYISTALSRYHKHEKWGFPHPLSLSTPQKRIETYNRTIFGWHRQGGTCKLYFSANNFEYHINIGNVSFECDACIYAVQFVYFIVFHTIFYYYCCILEIKYSRHKI